MADRTDSLNGWVWANGAVDPPAVPVTGVTYATSALTQTIVEVGWPYNQIANGADFNELLRRMTLILASLETYGVLAWGSMVQYEIGSVVMGSDGVIYKALSSNQGYDPISDGAVHWVPQVPDGIYRRNAVINGNFQINQRVKSGTVVLTSGQYGHDRFKAGASGCTYTFTSVANVTTLTIVSGSLIQVVEGVNLQSGTYVLSWTGTCQGKIGSGSYSASGVTGTVVGGVNTNLEFNTGTLSKVQFELGTIPTPFEFKTFAEELKDCQRYYEKSYDYTIAPGTATSVGALSCEETLVGNTIHNLNCTFLVPKRSTPTVTGYSTTGTINKVYLDYSGGYNLTIDNIHASQNRINLIVLDSASSRTGIPDEYLMHFVASAEL